MKALVLGMGNLLLGDEGVGVHAARALAQAPLPPGVTVLEAGTAVLDALPDLERADRVIVVDAMTAGGEPGTVYRLPVDRCARKAVVASMHGFDLLGVLALAGRADPPEVEVVGVEPASIDWSLELTPRVAASLPAVLRCVRCLLSPAPEPGRRPGRSGSAPRRPGAGRGARCRCGRRRPRA